MKRTPIVDKKGKAIKIGDTIYVDGHHYGPISAIGSNPPGNVFVDHKGFRGSEVIISERQTKGFRDMTNDVEGSVASDCYAAERLAGELFGRLETALGFGKLTLHKDARVFVFSWGFTAKGKSYGSQWFVDSQEMLIDRCMLDLAEGIARKWKAEHRKVSA